MQLFSYFTLKAIRTSNQSFNLTYCIQQIRLSDLQELVEAVWSLHRRCQREVEQKVVYSLPMLVKMLTPCYSK